MAWPFLNFTRALIGNRSPDDTLLANGVASNGAAHSERIPTDDQPLRLELFSIDQLEQHAKSLAARHSLALGRGPDRLLPRLAENEHVLLRAYELVNRAASKNRRIAPAGEWLLDNFYLVEEQIRTARRHLPRDYSRELPRLSNGANAGYPRVYDIAMELIAHVDGRVDAENLSTFVAAYQSVSTLRLGELWAVPIMLRLALIENLRRVAARIASGRQDRDRADAWADRMVEVSEKDPKSLVLVLADMARDNPALTSAFVAEISRRLQGQTPALALPMTWIEQNLAETGTTVLEMVQVEGQHQAADQVSIGNSIGSLRFLGAMDWREFVEALSAVEQVLRTDPAGIYPAMDFGTRDRYRHAVERVARRSDHAEDAIAVEAIRLATEARDAADRQEFDGSIHQGSRKAHVGYWLIDKGVPLLGRRIALRRSLKSSIESLARRVPLMLYGSVITLCTLALTVVTLYFGATHGLSRLALILITVPLHLSFSQLVVAVVNWMTMRLVSPRTLPRMDYADGVPEQCETMVVVPTMLSNEKAIIDLLESLEVHYLSNRDPHIHFALLTDLRDAEQETLDGDAVLIEQVRLGIESLNERYESSGATPFFLFHRPRKYNPAESCWMGWERKRGKLGDFNAILRGGTIDRFSIILGDTTVLPSVKYVITLDTDTQLPRDAAKELIGTMSHPLNRPIYDEKRGRVVEGYTILQPRVTVSLPSAGRSWFVRLFAGDPGIDPYTRAVSDVYQDLFEEGSFIGKGIYDVDSFERALAKRFPDNRILSHDLLEGSYARAGLLSDVVLFEDHPLRHAADVSRRHRWIRGDWQISSWLLPRVPGVDLKRVSNPISGLSRWKILDNLRRSLVPIAMTLLLLLAWAFPGPAIAFTWIVIAIALLPPVVQTIASLARRSGDLPWPMYSQMVLKSSIKSVVQAIFGLALLPYDAFVSIDAVVRTFNRVCFSRSRLLQWQTSSDAERAAKMQMAEVYVSMLVGPVTGIVALIILAIAHPQALPVAGVIAILWMIAPWGAWFISQPIARRVPRLTDDDQLFLRKLSRRTWQFFERFVSTEDNYLPPDNYQEHPTEVIAHRTSPTNIGLAMLCNVSAYDFGYVSSARLLERTEQTLATAEKLEKFNGQFFNWYDTRTLAPLMPLYVSTVDSGNLAGHLLVLKQALLAMERATIVSERAFIGLDDTAATLHELLRAAPTIERPRRTIDPSLLSRFDALRVEFARSWSGLGQSRELLVRVASLADELAAVVAKLEDAELGIYAKSFSVQAHDLLDDLDHIAPWLQLPEPIDTELKARLDTNITLAELSESVPDQGCGDDCCRAVELGSKNAADRIEHFRALADRVAKLAEEMDWDFLYDETRDLLSIGYNVADLRLDQSFYDLLASEARLASFVCIAQGRLPQAHWFALGRLLTSSGREPALLSWSGSMFEYLMPLLVMPTYDGTILDQTYKAVIKRQVEYGRERGVPWGVSESGYNTTDAQLNYQYRAFGVPGLGFKRGLAEDLVIAPYASVMGLMVDPEESVRNLHRLARNGLIGSYGFYEAVDYTSARVPRGKEFATVRSFMVHHEGMSLLSLAYLLLDRPMQKRFDADPILRATDLLLHERVPKVAPVFPHAGEVAGARRHSSELNPTLRVFHTPHTPAPEVHLLSNGRYQVMVTAAGGGYSRWRDLAVTRWREDATRDNWGSFVYLRDVTAPVVGPVNAAAAAVGAVLPAVLLAPASSATPPGEAWAVTYQPTMRNTRRYEAIFPQARAEFRCVENEIESYTEIAVSPEDDIELRRVVITNRSRTRRVIEVTTYAEVVLAPATADAAHATFSNLFVQTQLVRNRGAILCTRRPRSAGEKPPHMLHLTTVHGNTDGDVSFETDRSKFVGRGRSTASPAALERGSAADLSDSEGSVLDPIVAVRRRIVLGPQESARIDIVTGVTETRDAAIALVEKYHDRRLADRVFELSWTHSQVVLRQLNATESDAQLYGRLASSILFSNPSRRAPAGIISRNKRGQSGLWSYGISGDLPIVLLRVTEQQKLEFVKQIVQAHTYWRLKGLTVDLVIWNEDPSGYRQALQDSIMGMIASGTEAHALDRPGGIFVRRLDQIADEDKVLIQSVARVILADTAGTLEEQIEKRTPTREGPPRFVATRPKRLEPPIATEIIERDLMFQNGHGGFTRDGKEYVVTTTAENITPAPWCNVLANPYFGTVVSESGGAYTWLENAHEFRLTPWYNDPISDTTGEAFYIRDEETGRFFSPSPLPARGSMPYTTRHGFGYSVFEYAENGIVCEMWTYVAIDAPVKFTTIRVRNMSGRPRKISVTGYAEWVLGELRAKSMASVVTEIDLKTGVMTARNAYSNEFADRVAFFDGGESSTRTVTGDRTEFIGRNGSASAPAAMTRTKLSGRVGAGLDPCAAMQTSFELAENQERDIVFMIGCGRDVDDVRSLVNRFRGPQNARRALEEVWKYWSKSLGTLHVETPDPALNVLANGWLPYQVLACRVWARSGFYQSGGAFGFRDQLQDVMSLIYSEPALYREHMLKCASRQFRQGDVQHWWHPPVGRGVRTHFSDDYLWLPYAAIRYVDTTGDTGVLDEKIHFLDGRLVNPDEESYYDLPNRSDESRPFYEHCKRSIENGLRFGEHGLPLIGCGDWNDGMNLIGEHGKGESVWLAFFLFAILRDFAPIAEARGDTAFAQQCSQQAETLRQNIEANAWDGAWYRRAYFDNGEPLGSRINEECQVDSLPQSWAVLSGGGDPARARQGMAAVDQRLVKRGEGLIQLFDPPFDKSEQNPGYIKGYVPGVRENGGQYTHAAVWTVMAYAVSGDTQRAWELFNLINPVHHGDSADKIATYKVEPYVVAADVYAVAPHIGRGGWTWYTGSAGWMYRLITESLLGMRLTVDRLRFEPVVPPSWTDFTIHYRFRETMHHITIRFEGPGRTTRRITLDGNELYDGYVLLVDDRREHRAEVVIG